MTRPTIIARTNLILALVLRWREKVGRYSRIFERENPPHVRKLHDFGFWEKPMKNMLTTGRLLGMALTAPGLLVAVAGWAADPAAVPDQAFQLIATASLPDNQMISQFDISNA